MVRIALLAIIALHLASCGALKAIPTDFPTPSPSPQVSALAKLDYKRDAELEARFAAIAGEAKGKVGAAAVVLETGEAAFLDPDGRYPMQSVYKLPIAMAVVDKVRLDKLDLDEKIGVSKDDFVRQGQRSPLRDQNPNGGEFTIRELVRLSLVESDGTASDVLLRIAGGPSEVQAHLAEIGVNDLRVINSEKEIGRDWETQYQNWSTPAASVELLRWLDASVDHWEPPNLDDDLNDNRLCLQYMFESPTGPKRIKGLLPLENPMKVAAHKTGSGGARGGVTSATNDIGIVYAGNGRRIAIAVFVSDSTADEKTREAVIARIAKAGWDRWVK